LPWLFWNNREPAIDEALKNVSIATLILGAIHQLAHAAIFEEPIFRGFLWGYLRKVNWKEKWILLFQAGYHLNKPG
jgi:membrane protease YdiL (CAAX protease family)